MDFLPFLLALPVNRVKLRFRVMFFYNVENLHGVKNVTQ